VRAKLNAIASFNPSAQLRHGEGKVVDGYLLKVGKTMHMPTKRYIRLTGASLTSSRDESSPPSWEKSVLDCKVYGGSKPKHIIIEMEDRRLELIAETEEEARVWIKSFEDASGQKLEAFYKMGHTIGAGAFGTVRLARSKDPSDERMYVVKILEKTRKNQRKFLERETAILRSIRHPNIVSIYDIFENDKALYLVMEYCPGGDLFDMVCNTIPVTEQHAAAIFSQLLSALVYLHSKGIVHRDIKPANFLSSSSTEPFEAKLTDFGLSNVVSNEDHEMLRTNVGTPYFLAPEMILEEPYDSKVDMWAMGVSLYFLISGSFPFTGSSKKEAFEKMVRARFSFSDPVWKETSAELRNFIEALLQRDPTLRFSAEEALEHPWLTAVGPKTTTILETRYLSAKASGLTLN